MTRTSQSDYELSFRWIAPTNKPHKGHVTTTILDNANSQSVEFVYGIESDFLFDGGHLGICNTAVFPLYMMVIDYQSRLKEVTQRLDYYTENRLWTNEAYHADYLVYSFVFLFLNPRDYTGGKNRSLFQFPRWRKSWAVWMFCRVIIKWVCHSKNSIRKSQSCGIIDDIWSSIC